MRFRAQLDALFSHDPQQTDWYWTEPSPEHAAALEVLHADPAAVVDMLDEMLGGIDDLLLLYGPQRLGAGVNFIFNASLSDFAFSLGDAATPQERRVRVAQNLRLLFDRLFTPHCRHALSHLAPSGSLNGVCYMFWDVTPLMQVGAPEVSRACLEVMEHCLASPNPAVVESGLHGLGHAVHAFPEARIAIEAWLQSASGSAELRAYAVRARAGAIN